MAPFSGILLLVIWLYWLFAHPNQLICLKIYICYSLPGGNSLWIAIPAVVCSLLYINEFQSLMIYWWYAISYMFDIHNETINSKKMNSKFLWRKSPNFFHRAKNCKLMNQVAKTCKTMAWAWNRRLDKNSN